MASYYFRKKQKTKSVRLVVDLEDEAKRKSIIEKLENAQLAELMKEYGVSDTTIYRVLKDKNITWDKSKSNFSNRRV